MVDVKISGLPAAAALTGNEAIPAVQGGGSVKLLVSAIRAGLAADGNVVHTSGTESIGGTKTFQVYTYFSGGLASDGTITIRGDGTGAARLMRIGGTRTADGPAYFDLVAEANRSDYNTRFYRSGGVDGDTNINHRGAGVLALNAENAGSIDLRISGTSAMRVNSDRSVTFGGNAAAMAATRVSLGAVGLVGAEQVSGVKTFSSEVRIQNVAPGFWLDESDGANGFFAVVDSGVYQLQVRGPNFGGYVRQMLQVSASGGTFAMGGDLVRPLADNAQALGASNYRFTSLWSVNGAVQTSDARLKTPLECMTDVEEAAFLEISALPAKWKWRARVEEEGDEARWHAGPSVQAAIAVMEKHGLSAFAYSAFCYDSWPAEDEVWREWPAQEAEVVEWPAVPETWAEIPAEVDEAGEIVIPARRELVHEAMPAGRVVLKEPVEAGRELVRPAVQAGDRYSFRVSELQAWILAAMARRERREREAVEQRLVSIEQRLAVLETGK
ncbi:tail fiber domain-containing protein [Stenotrophomonas maltophilia]|uniref:tail fiber domain-containing protein n=1 Tax=Stenotrophomonas maltophilia TaxID=40324 RepID=UPI000F68DBC6|nr:tail fiber domain-containing protein [Stenotrophomonas maltophilia]EKU9976035.1 tail fiber domain-containing protein [Stenotrophomonas maltophilia]RRU67032.1 tail fiber domain-containing protein [Stenotrophomonas maltophilia]